MRWLRLLGGSRLIQPAVVLLLTSLMVSYVVGIAYDLRVALPYVVGASDNVYVIYDSRSMALFTGLVPLRLTDAISGTEGVIGVSPEVLVPALVDGRVAFVRGISPDDFLRVTGKLRVVEGRWFKSGDGLNAVVGESLANKLGVGVGDLITVSSTMSDVTLALKVVGVFDAPPPFNDEIITGLGVGEALRGVEGYVSFIRVRVVGAGVAKELAKKFALAGAPTASEALKGLPSWLLKAIASGRVKVGSVNAVMSDYSDAYGLTRSSTAALAGIVLSVGAAAAAMSSAAYSSSVRPSLALLLALGFSRRRVMRELALKVIPLYLAASFVGYTLNYLLTPSLGLQVLFHEVRIPVNPYLAAATASVPALAAALPLLNSVRGVMPDEVR